MGYFLYSASENDKKYGKSATRDDITYYTGKRDEALQNALVNGIIGAILVPAGTVLLIRKNKAGKSGREVSYYPLTGAGNGFQVVVQF